MVEKKKVSWLYILLGAVLSGYAGYLLGGVYEKQMQIVEFMEKLNMVLNKPFANYFNENTVKAIFIGLGIYILLILIHLTSQKNYMHGKEFGTSIFGNAKQIRKRLQDKSENNNRILSQNIKMSINTRHTRLNNNMLVIGGSGAGKTLFMVKPNLMQLNTSYICTDPKSEILNTCGEFLKANGYEVKVLNLLSMEASDCYNPFHYIREEKDVVKLITNLIANTTPKEGAPSDPFWTNAESLYLQALFYYVWLELPKKEQNFRSILMLLNEAEVKEKGLSDLDKRMKELEKHSPLGKNHPAIKQYNKCVRGAGDTVRSIIISANSRLGILENGQVLRILDKDDMYLEQIGIGKNGDGKTKTALFCVIPDNDKSYNFIVGLLYSQAFQELYYQADFNCGGRLPIHVSMLFDEFANVALPNDFCSLLSTMRSREISSVIIIQNLAQIKALFKDTWETITGNCDSLVYLGGNEASTHEYISKLLGKATIDKRTTGETLGKNGSSSKNYDVLGRELMTPDEVREMDNKKCLAFIRGFSPIYDNKFNTFKHKMFVHSADGKGNIYVHKRSSEKSNIKQPLEILNQKSFEYYKICQQKGENVFVNEFSYEDIMSMSVCCERGEVFVKEQESEECISEQNITDEEYYPEDVLKAIVHEHEAKMLEEKNSKETNQSKESESQEREMKQSKNYQKEIEETEKKSKNISSKHMSNSILKRMSKYEYTDNQMAELKKAMESGVKEKQILDFFYPDVSVEKMQEVWMELARLNNNK